MKRVLHEKDETGSTNDDARALALSGAPDGTAILARRQTKGRGRAGRAWASPEGGLYLSVVLRPALAPHKWSLLPLAFGAAVVDALRARGHAVDLKWPNDVLLRGRKVGGILVESRGGADPFVIAGLGLNVAAAPELVDGAAGLAMEGPLRVVAEELVAALVSATRSLERDGPAPTLERVRATCVTLGKHVEWEKGEGLAIGIADDGSLVVEQAGVAHRVVAGDVRVRQALD